MKDAAAPDTADIRVQSAWFTLVVLMLAQTCSFIDRMIMGLLVGPIRQSFQISDTQFSLLTGLAFAIFYSIMGLPLARLADRYSRKWIIAIGIAFWSVMTALCGLAQGYWSLFLARVGVGVGEATLSPAAFSLLSDSFSKRTLARALSVFTLGVTIGSGIAYMVGGQVVALTQKMGVIHIPVVGEIEAWQATFFIVGIPGLLIATLVLLLREPPRRGVMKAADGAPQTQPSIGEVLAYFASRRRAIFTHVLGVSIFIMAVYSMNIWGPEYLVRTFDYTRPQAGLTFGAIIMVTGAAGLLSGGFLADRWYQAGKLDAYSRVILYSALCMLPCAVLLAFARTPLEGCICLGAAVYFSAFQGGVSGGVMQLMTPNQMRGQAAALFFLAANLIGLGFGPTVVAACTDYIFRDDAALNKSLALTSAVLIPIAALIIASGLRQVREAIAHAQSYG